MSTRTASRLTSSNNGHSATRRNPAATNGRPAPRVANRVRKATNGRASKFPSSFSEARGEATLQATAGARADRLSVRYKGDEVQLELAGHGQLLLQGLWECVVSVDGEPVPLTGEWESSCWNADEDADYLELQFRVDEKLRIDRQILLPRSGNYAILADAIIAPGAGELEVRTRFPLPSDIKFSTERLTRSARLRGPAGVVRAHPLALPQERVHSAPGDLIVSGGALELVQRQKGSALYLPLVIDWNPKRAGGAVQWRNLTVSEQRKTLRIDEAAGYRLRMGKDQFLVYHSLHNTGEARAVLGHHTWNETVIGGVKADGTIAPLILIEQA